MGKQARRTSRRTRNAKAAQQRRARTRFRLLAGAGGLVILGLVVAIAVTLVNAAGGGDPPTTGERQVVAPANVTATGAILVGKAAAPVRLEVYLDYMCPFCGRFERANSAELERLVADGTVRLELYALSFLDSASAGSRYSTRTANAIATVADRAPDKVLRFNAALFARQPAEGSHGLSNDEIATTALGAGVPADVVSLFTEGRFEPWVAKVTETAVNRGITATPTVRLNGRAFEGDLYTAGPLTQAIIAAKGE